MSWLWLLLIGAGFAAWTALKPTPPPESRFQPKRRLLVVSQVLAGDDPSPVSEWAADCLSQELDLLVDVQQKPMVVSKKAFHPDRGQGNAVALVELLEPLVTPDCAVLGIIDYDLHSPLRKDLPFALGARKGWAGLISTYRMEDKRHPENTRARLQKMLIRYGAELACDAQRESDPRSVLYESLQRPAQLDLMSWPPESEPSP